MDNKGNIALIVIILFLIMFVVMTLMGALFLWVCINVFNVGTFKWTYAFVIGLLLTLIIPKGGK